MFTNLSPEHLDYHETMAMYFQAKLRLFEQLAAEGREPVAIVNRDDEWGMRLWDALPHGLTRIGYGCLEQADVRAKRVETTTRGFRCEVTTPWGDVELASPLLGLINVSNALAACTVGGVLGVSLDDMQRGLAAATLIPGRMERVQGGADQPQVFVDYAHTPDALRKALETLRAVAEGQVTVVFGCGGDRDREKRPAMGRVAETLADAVILTNDNPRTEDPDSILQQVRAGMGASADVVLQPDRRAAITKAISMSCKEDLVLIAGKGHETYQEFASTVEPFDDREVAREVLQGVG